MPEPAWKQFERAVAAWLGSRRIPVGEDVQSRTMLGDVEHERFYLSCRLRRRLRLAAWLEEIRDRAAAAGKVPVVVARQPRHSPVYICCDAEDLSEVARGLTRTRDTAQAARNPSRPRARRRQEAADRPARARGSDGAHLRARPARR